MLLDFHHSLSLSCPSFIHSLALRVLEQTFLQDPFLSNKREALEDIGRATSIFVLAYT
jgi:hypothetical protein